MHLAHALIGLAVAIWSSTFIDDPFNDAGPRPGDLVMARFDTRFWTEEGGQRQYVGADVQTWPASVHRAENGKLFLGRAWMDSKQALTLPKAVEYFTRQIKERPDDWQPLRLRAVVRAELKQFQGAVDDYLASAEKGADRAEVYADLSNVYREWKNADVAMRYANKSLKLRPDYPLALTMRALLHQNANDSNQALRDVNQALRHDGKYRTALMYRGIILTKLGRSEEALKDLSAAIAQGQDSALVYISRAAALQQLGRRAEAVGDARLAVARNRDQAYTHLCLGHHLLKDNEVNGAEISYRRALHCDPHAIGAIQAIGFIHEARGQWDKAIEQYTQAIRFAPRDSGLYIRRGTALIRLGQLREAIADFDKAMEIRPTAAAAYTNRGIAWAQLDELNKATADYTKAIEIITGSPNAASRTKELASLYGFRGRVARARRDLKFALADLDEAVRLWPDSPLAHNERGNVLATMGRLDEARKEFEATISLDDKNVDAMARLGSCERLVGNTEAAIEMFSRALRINPNHVASLHNRGFALAELGQFERAVVDLNRAVRLQPDDGSLFLTRGMCWMNAEKYRQAIGDFTRALELRPEDLRSYGFRAYCYFESGDVVRSLQDYEQYRKLQPQNHQPWVAAARVLATWHDAKHRDGPSAVRLASKACELTNWRDPQSLLALAAAHAECGEFPQAIRRQREAMNLLPRGEADVEAETLKLYERNKPLRYESGKKQAWELGPK